MTDKENLNFKLRHRIYSLLLVQAQASQPKSEGIVKTYLKNSQKLKAA